MLAAILVTPFSANAQDDRLARMNDVEVGLLTCSPHHEVFSLYGHSAIHWHDLRTGRHFVFNYGVFDFKSPHFVWRFVMGETDYRLECYQNFQAWCKYYKDWGSKVEEQILDLTPSEKQRLEVALGENLRNPVYRYNFFYDNCSTRPRDIIERCLEGKVKYTPRDGYSPTYREMIHECTKEHPWAAFGNDLLLGIRADMKTDMRQQEFLPQNLSYDFDNATIERNGEIRPLVLRHATHIPPGNQPLEGGFPLSPLACTLILLLISIAIFVLECLKKSIWIWWDALLMLTTGLAGCILALMIFSEHPATSINLQILILNPLSLFFIPHVIRRKKTPWFKISLCLVILFLMGSFWQDYAEGMEIVALCLLLRYWIHRNEK